MMTTDPLLGALGDLAAPAPTSLTDTVLDRWVRAPGPLGDALVAFTTDGVSFLRTAGSVGDDVATFLDAYRDRFRRPLRPADRAPRGLLPALRGGRAGGPDLDLRGLSDFERAVLTATRRIPAGETRPYAWVAREVGRPRAVRAVGTVLARNPVPLLVPCHRVTRSDGAVGEYLFGAAHKDALLRGEDVDVDGVRDLAARGMHVVGSDTTGVVCYPTCHHARRITDAHRHGFRSTAAAVEAGYRPCHHCRPGTTEEAA